MVGHYENFPVASLLLPAAMRRDVAAVYHFARSADDFADEGDLPPAERHRLLDGWYRRLHGAVAGLAQEPVATGEPARAREMFQELGVTIASRALPVSLFEDLLSAFRQDVSVTRYRTWADMMDYCRRSANPVGRIVLRIAGLEHEQFDRWSDSICTALQLTNFWQDFKIDFDRGRIYLPAELAAGHGADEGQLSEGLIPPAWQAALREAAARTRQLFVEGRPLCDAVSGRLRYELRATWLGGVRILDRLDACRYDVAVARPRLRAGDAPWFLGRMLTWTPDVAAV